VRHSVRDHAEDDNPGGCSSVAACSDRALPSPLRDSCWPLAGIDRTGALIFALPICGTLLGYA